MPRFQFRSDRTEEMQFLVKPSTDFKGVPFVIFTVYTRGSTSTHHLSRRDIMSLRDVLTHIIDRLPTD